MAGIADVVAQLYSLLPEAFTAARNQRASDAAKAGDKPAGKAIRALPKPSSSAWLVNMLTLHRPELIAEVLELGAVLREAQNDLDQKQLRQLSGERQRLLRSAAREARSLAAELGHPASAAVGAEVEQTLWAAMTDADAAAAASSGQLVRALEANGWDPVDVAGAVADPGSVRPVSPGVQQRPPGEPQRRRPDTASATDNGGHAPRAGASVGDAESAAAVRRERAAAARALRAARTTLQEAQQDAEQAEDILTAAQQAVDALADRRDELTDEIDELRERIRDLERLVATVDRRAGTLERERDAARRSARAARRAVEKAQARLESLG